MMRNKWAEHNMRRHDTQHNDIQHNDTEHKGFRSDIKQYNTQHNNTVIILNVVLSVAFDL